MTEDEFNKINEILNENPAYRPESAFRLVLNEMSIALPNEAFGFYYEAEPFLEPNAILSPFGTSVSVTVGEFFEELNKNLKILKADNSKKFTSAIKETVKAFRADDKELIDKVNEFFEERMPMIVRQRYYLKRVPERMKLSPIFGDFVFKPVLVSNGKIAVGIDQNGQGK